MKFLDGIKVGFGVTIGSILGLYASAVVIGFVKTKSETGESEKSDETTETFIFKKGLKNYEIKFCKTEKRKEHFTG